MSPPIRTASPGEMLLPRWRITSRKTGLSALAPERDERGKPIQYAFQAFEAVRSKIGADGFADCICSLVPADITPMANGQVSIVETGKIA